jgi:diguanylate cyclase (GGDEF)-like protein
MKNYLQEEGFEGTKQNGRKLIKKLFSKKSMEVKQGILRQDTYLTEVVTLLTALIETGFFIWSNMNYGCFTESSNKLVIYSQLLYLTIGIYSYAMFIFCVRHGMKMVERPRLYEFVLSLYYIVLVLFGIYLAAIYKIEGANAYILILVFICSYGVIIMNPIRMFVTTIISYAIFNIVFIYYGIFAWYHTFNILETLFYLNVIGLMRYYLICEHFENNHKLEDYSTLLEKLSFNDNLTSLKNRNALRRDWNTFIGNTYSVMVVDIDDFKEYNDTYGHLAGDHVIKSVAEKMIEIFGEDHVYRLGGDEFLIISTVQNPEVNTCLESLLNKVQTIEWQGKNLGVTLSIGGVKGTCVKVDDMRTFMAKADEVLYEVKEQGKNSFLYKKGLVDTK